MPDATLPDEMVEQEAHVLAWRLLAERHRKGVVTVVPFDIMDPSVPIELYCRAPHCPGKSGFSSTECAYDMAVDSYLCPHCGGTDVRETTSQPERTLT